MHFIDLVNKKIKNNNTHHLDVVILYILDRLCRLWILLFQPASTVADIANMHDVRSSIIHKILQEGSRLNIIDIPWTVLPHLHSKIIEVTINMWSFNINIQ